MEQIQIKASNYLIQQNYEEAIKLYTEILNEQQSVDALLSRCIAYMNTNQIDKALHDTEKIIILNPRQLFCQYYKGVCLFKTGLIEEAEKCFTQEMDNISLNNSQIAESTIKSLSAKVQIWISKVKAEKSNQTLTQFIKENREKIEQEMLEAKKKLDEQDQAKKLQDEKKNQNLQYIQTKSGKLSYSWYQTDNTVVIEIYQKINKKEQLQVEYESKSVDVTIPLTNSSEYKLYLDLSNEIDSAKSTSNVWLDKIELVMIKKTPKQNWIHLEAGNVQNIQNAPSYPTSSKTKKDWSKLDKELDKEIGKDGDPLQSIFNEIYQNADEDTKKAMIKSYQTSGGTVLSTNWGEVKEKDYEGKDRPDAPKGQEWAKKN